MSAAFDPPLTATITEGELNSLRELPLKRKWWADYPFIVSALAFCLSLATSLVSAYESHRHDIHDQQTQLSSALSNLQEINLRIIEVHEKYKNGPYEGQATALLNTQVNTTLRTASDLSLALGSNAPAAALTGVAQGLYGLGDYVTSEKLLKFALAASQTANDRSVALNYLGFLKIRTGRGGAFLQQGEDYYTRSLNLDHEYDLSEHPSVVAWLRLTAQLGWAAALAEIDCGSAQKHFGAGISILATAPELNIDFEQARSQAKIAWTAGIGGSCRLSTGS